MVNGLNGLVQGVSSFSAQVPLTEEALEFTDQIPVASLRSWRNDRLWFTNCQTACLHGRSHVQRELQPIRNLTKGAHPLGCQTSPLRSAGNRLLKSANHDIGHSVGQTTHTPADSK